MQTVIKTIAAYTYDELTDTAKDKARQWLISATTDNTYWYESVIDAAKDAAAIMGIDIDDVYFSGFGSQGDGACFTGRYAYAKGAAAKIEAEWSKDATLQRIARDLQRAQKRAFYTATARITHGSRYCHSYSMRADVDSDKGANIEDDLQSAFRDFADWIYDSLQKEYEYITSVAQLAETAECNEWLFDENGGRTVVI